MPSGRPRILYVTDLAYQARGRRYCDEDIFLTSRLRDGFDLALCHPRDAAALMDAFDAVVVRNSGPVLGHLDAHTGFRARAAALGARVYNPLTGRADMAGKQYLLDLTAAGHPVIPTVDRPEDLHRLPEARRYVVKPKLGADSLGLRDVPADRLREVVAAEAGEVLAQPRVDFAYEVSFYFVDDGFQYALYAPDPARRWQLEPYTPRPRTSRSPGGSSTGTRSRTASSASTPAAPRRRTAAGRAGGPQPVPVPGRPRRAGPGRLRRGDDGLPAPLPRIGAGVVMS